MTILNTISLKSNKQIKINFNGGDLSSDGGLLLIKEFAARAGLIKLIQKLFKTNDHTACRIHTDPDNLMQVIYQIIAAYFEDDCADELTKDPVMNAILKKDSWHRSPRYPGSGTGWTAIHWLNSVRSLPECVRSFILSILRHICCLIWTPHC